MLWAMMLTNQIHKLNCANQAIFGVSISDGAYTENCLDAAAAAAAAQQIYPTEKHTQQVCTIHALCVRIYGNDDGDDDSSGGGGGGDDGDGDGSGSGGWFGLGSAGVYVSEYIFR